VRGDGGGKLPWDVLVQMSSINKRNIRRAKMEYELACTDLPTSDRSVVV
jgi:hypothetical protein